MSITFPSDPIPLLFLSGYLGSGLVTVAFAVYAFRYRWDRQAVRAFGVISLLLAIWSIAYVGRMLSPTLSTKLLWTQLAWVGITVAPVAVLAFVLLFTGRTHLVSRRTVGAMLVIPVVTQLLLLTNDRHGLFYESVWLYTGDSIPFIASRGGAWFYGVHLPYSWGLYFVATVLLVQFAFATNHVYRNQTIALLFGALFPWVVNGTFLAGVRVHPELDPTPIAIGVGMSAIAIAVLRVDLLGILPVARETVFDEVETCLFVLDDAERVVDVNAAGEVFLRSTTGMSWSPGDPAGDVLPPELADQYRSESRWGREAEVRVDVAGDDAWYVVRSYRLDHPHHSGRIVTVTDITAQKRQQEQLERQNESLERVAGVVSHDLRNPLGVGKGYLSLLADELEGLDLSAAERESIRTHVGKIETAHERMDDLVEDVLVLARTGQSAAATDRIDLGTLARDAWTHVDTGDAELEIVDSTTLSGNRRRLLRVFENLYRNAISHGEGTTTVRVGVLEDGFFVEDDGVGIPVDSRRTVFERGVTSDDDGTGLGLSIIRAIVEAQGWEISVAEGEAGGARFEITGVDVVEG